MAPASPSAVLAVSDRPLPERPDTKSTDGSEGQFAGLMAQFVHTPPPPRAPDAPPPPRPEQDTKVRPSEDKPMAPQAPAAPPEKPSPRAEAPAAKPETAEAKTETPKATPDTTEPATGRPMVPAKANTPEGTALNRLQDAIAALTGAAKATAMATGTGTVAGDSTSGSKTTPALTPVPTSSLATSLADSASKGLDAKAGTVTVQFTPATVPALPKSPSTPVPPSPPSQQTAPSAEPKAEPGAQADSTHLPSTPIAQAVIAGSLLGTKSSDGHGPTADAPRSDMPLKGEVVKPLEGSPLSQVPAPPVGKNPTPPAPLVNAQEKAIAANQTVLKAAGDSELVPTSLEALAARASSGTQAPSAHTPDGSALAALNTASRTPLESAPAVAAPTPTVPTPFTPPTAPVLQVEGGLRWMMKGGVQEAQLQLHPESLGQVTIHLKVEGGEVHARLWVTEPASVQAVQEGRPHLEQSLKEQGLQLGSFDLHQGHRPFQEAPSAPTFREPSSGEPAITRQEAPVPAVASILNPHHVELYA